MKVEINVIAEIDNVVSSIEFLQSKSVDLIISDIELIDGNAFDIFKRVSITSPIIFTTAYDKFWMDAFESNGIAYLLKPFSRERFQKAWNKFILFKNSTSKEHQEINNLIKFLEHNTALVSYKKRYSVNTHGGFFYIDVDNITFFQAHEGVIFAYDSTGKKHLLNVISLKDIEAQLNPSHFLRINRSEVISKEHVERIERYSNNVLAIKMKGQISLLKTSQSNTSSFRFWVEN